MVSEKRSLSIITLSYNQGKYISECIKSINIQRVGINIEHIVVDAGSTDGSRSIIDQFPEIIKIYETDEGPADGLNKGFKHSTGDICAFLNADDFYIEGGLREIEKIFENKEVDMVIAGGYVLLRNGKKKYIKPKNLNHFLLLNGVARIFQPGIFFRRWIIEKYSFNKNNKTCWDYEFLVDILHDNINIKIIDIPVAYFRIHENSITGKKNNNLNYHEDLDRIYFNEKGRSRSIKYLIVNFFLRLINKLY
jgi:glycosyltransferase involved in cell wall biosynthesis